MFLSQNMIFLAPYQKLKEKKKYFSGCLIKKFRVKIFLKSRKCTGKFFEMIMKRENKLIKIKINFLFCNKILYK